MRCKRPFERELSARRSRCVVFVDTEKILRTTRSNVIREPFCEAQNARIAIGNSLDEPLTQDRTRRLATPRARLETDLLLQDLVHGLRICFAAGRLHHLTDEPSDRLRLCSRLLHFVGVGGNDLVRRSSRWLRHPSPASSRGLRPQRADRRALRSTRSR